MTKEEQILKQEIMMRVRFIYGVKALPGVFIPKLALLASMVAVTGFFVSMPNVLSNMPNILDIGNFMNFLMSAFVNTKLAVQMACMVATVVSLFMLRDVVKTFRETRAFSTV